MHFETTRQEQNITSLLRRHWEREREREREEGERERERMYEECSAAYAGPEDVEATAEVSGASKV